MLCDLLARELDFLGVVAVVVHCDCLLLEIRVGIYQEKTK